MIQEFIELHGARENNLKNIMPIVVDQKRLGGGSHSTVGTIVYEGSFDGLLRADTITGNHLQHAMRRKDTFRKPIGDQLRRPIPESWKKSAKTSPKPTTGLHMSDISHLLAVINRIVDNGNTVVVIEHNRGIIKNADWIIDMGPEGGHKGGQILFEGTPKDLLNVETSYTAQYLRSEHQPI